MSASEFKFRYYSKNKIYKFFSAYTGAYIAPSNLITIYLMKDKISEKNCK
jgi:hypothetical protein